MPRESGAHAATTSGSTSKSRSRSRSQNRWPRPRTGDKINVKIDGAWYYNINIGSAASIANVASAINTAVGVTVATVSTYLVITSPNTGLASNVEISDGLATTQSVIGKLFASSSKTSTGTVNDCVSKLFSVVANRTDTGLYAFDRITNAFKVPVGTEKAIVGTRDQGLIFFGSDQVWRLIPSVVPSATTDFPERIIDIGCVATHTVHQVADDIMFLSSDGVRGLFRTQLDKLQAGESFPLSYLLKDEVGNINWSKASDACAIYFDNKYIISVPTGVSAYNNQVWVYYPATKAWVIIEGWNIARFAKLKINGEERLYGIDSVTGAFYRLFYGTNDNGTAIALEEISRAEDFGQPIVYKTGGEFKLRARGGNGTIVVSANPDGEGWTQLGTLDLSVISGISFPTTFPLTFGRASEAYGSFHLDSAGITKFKRVKFKIYCNSLDSALEILESIATAFADEYLPED